MNTRCPQCGSMDTIGSPIGLFSPTSFAALGITLAQTVNKTLPAPFNVPPLVGGIVGVAVGRYCVTLIKQYKPELLAQQSSHYCLQCHHRFPSRN